MDEAIEKASRMRRKEVSGFENVRHSPLIRWRQEWEAGLAPLTPFFNLLVMAHRLSMKDTHEQQEHHLHLV
jgi:hypothetical protein